MRNGLRFILVVLWWAIFCPSTVCAALCKRSFRPCGEADSVMSHVCARSGECAGRIGEFRAGFYTKVRLDIEKKNLLFRYIPSLFRGERGVNGYISELCGDMHYTAPDIYDWKITAMSGTLRNEKTIPGVTDYLSVNIYATYLLGDRLLSPLSRNARRYYMYVLDHMSRDSLGRALYHISFRPKNRSLQLVSGTMVVTDSAWTVRSFRFRGRQGQLKFDCRMEMGATDSGTETLPLSSELKVRFAFLRNRVSGRYSTVFSYGHVAQKIPGAKKRHGGYDLSATYSLRCAPSGYRREDMLPDSLRRITLTPGEAALYGRKAERRDSAADKAAEARRVKRRERWERVGAFLIEDYKWRLADKGTLRSMALLNPMQFGFSGSNGISYKNDLKFRGMLKGDRSVFGQSRIGYNFKLKEFYWSLNGGITYWPCRCGNLSISVGNGNRIYSSDVLEDLKSIPDSLFDFDKLHLDLFKDLYVTLNHGVEVCNGLQMDVGVKIHRRTPLRKPEFSPETNSVEQELSRHIRSDYVSFAPRVRLSWTPGLYYYMSGRQKVNLRSRYPTFIADYERGVRNVFRSSVVYERIELDMQHRIRPGVTQSLFYRLGAGLFTNREQTYFVDFENFRSNNLPLDRKDDIGGVFQALDSRWYNASNHYVRAHLVYEAPFLFLRHLMKYTGYVQNERLYLNVLSMPHLRPYMELGYGVGTHVFDLGLFVSSRNYTDFGFGWKFTFRLFR